MQYAKTKSHATLRREDPTFVPPTAAQSTALADKQTKTSGASTLQKRGREDEMADEEGRAQKRKPADDAESDEGEEMEIDDDEEAGPKAAAANSMSCILPRSMPMSMVHTTFLSIQQQLPKSWSGLLHVYFALTCRMKLRTVSFRSCSNSACQMFRSTSLRRSPRRVHRYQGFQSTHVAPSPTSNAAGQKAKMAQVLYDAPELATVAKEALDGFTLKKGWVMSVAYA